MRERYLIKVVPDDEPDHDGLYREVEMPGPVIGNWRAAATAFAPHVPADHHLAAYERKPK